MIKSFFAPRSYPEGQNQLFEKSQASCNAYECYMNMTCAEADSILYPHMQKSNKVLRGLRFILSNQMMYTINYKYLLRERLFNGRVRCDFLVQAHRGKYELEADPNQSGREERNFVVFGLPFFQNFYTMFNYTSLTLYIDFYQDFDRKGYITPTVRREVFFFQQGDMIVLGISLVCLAMFVYQLYVIVMRDKLLTTV